MSEGPLLDRDGIRAALTRLGERLARRGVVRLRTGSPHENALTWAFTLKSCPECPCGLAPGQYDAESLAFRQVSASQGSYGDLAAYCVALFAIFRYRPSRFRRGLFSSLSVNSRTVLLLLK